MTLSITTHGAQIPLAFLDRVHRGHQPSDSDLQSVLSANRFFVGFYCQCPGVTPHSLSEALRCFARPDWKPTSPVQAALQTGAFVYDPAAVERFGRPWEASTHTA